MIVDFLTILDTALRIDVCKLKLDTLKLIKNKAFDANYYLKCSYFDNQISYIITYYENSEKKNYKNNDSGLFYGYSFQVLNPEIVFDYIIKPNENIFHEILKLPNYNNQLNELLVLFSISNDEYYKSKISTHLMNAVNMVSLSTISLEIAVNLFKSILHPEFSFEKKFSTLVYGILKHDCASISSLDVLKNYIAENKSDIKAYFSNDEISFISDFIRDYSIVLKRGVYFSMGHDLISKSIAKSTEYFSNHYNEFFVKTNIKEFEDNCQILYENITSTIEYYIEDFKFFHRFLFFIKLKENIILQRFEHHVFNNYILSKFILENEYTNNYIVNTNNNENNDGINDNVDALLDNDSNFSLNRMNLYFEYEKIILSYNRKINFALDFFASAYDDELFENNNNRKPKIINKTSFGFKVNSKFNLLEFYKLVFNKYNHAENDNCAIQIVDLLKSDNLLNSPQVIVNLRTNIFLVSLSLVMHLFDNLTPKAISKYSVFTSKKGIPFSDVSIRKFIQKDKKIKEEDYETLTSFFEQCKF